MKRSRTVIAAVLALLLVALSLLTVRLFHARQHSEVFPERLTIRNAAEAARLRDELVGRHQLEALRTLPWVDQRTQVTHTFSVDNLKARLDHCRGVPTLTEKLDALFGDWRRRTAYTPYATFDPASVWRVPCEPIAGELVIHFEHHNVASLEFMPANQK